MTVLTHQEPDVGLLAHLALYEGVEVDGLGRLGGLSAWFLAQPGDATNPADEDPMPLPSDIKPPFTRETALAKVQAAEDAWNSRDPGRIALAYTEDTQWRNRSEFLTGREAVKAFLRSKFAQELEYRLRKELWAFDGARISVRFEYEWRDHAGQWWRSHGNEQWEFAPDGLMRRRDASINDVPITADERRLRL